MKTHKVVTQSNMIPKSCDLILLLALMRQESGFNPQIVNSRSGAAGLMQLMKPTFDEHTRHIKNADRFNPLHNIIAGCLELNRCIEMFGDLRLALTAYNWGIGNMSKFIQQARSKDWEVLKNFEGKRLNRKTGIEEKWTMPQEAKEYAYKIFRHYNDPLTLELAADYKGLFN